MLPFAFSCAYFISLGQKNSDILYTFVIEHRLTTASLCDTVVIRKIETMVSVFLSCSIEKMHVHIHFVIVFVVSRKKDYKIVHLWRISVISNFY